MRARAKLEFRINDLNHEISAQASARRRRSQVNLACAVRANPRAMQRFDYLLEPNEPILTFLLHIWGPRWLLVETVAFRGQNHLSEPETRDCSPGIHQSGRASATKRDRRKLTEGDIEFLREENSLQDHHADGIDVSSLDH